MSVAVVALAAALGGCDEPVGDTGGGGTCEDPAAAFVAGASTTASPAPIPATRTPGALHTAGQALVGADDAPVRLTGVTWSGFETDRFAPHGLWARSLRSMFDQMKRLGYNLVRLPFSDELLASGGAAPPAGAIDYDKNPDLFGLAGVDLLDAVAAAAGERDIRVLLVRAGPRAVLESGRESAACADDAAGWYSARVPEQRLVDDWQAIARRLRARPAVIGAELSAPPLGVSWGDGAAATDWRAAAERIGDAVLDEAPEWLIVVPVGAWLAAGDDPHAAWYAGDLRPTKRTPVRLRVPDQLVWAVHEPPPSLLPGADWFASPSYPDNLEAHWYRSWGFVVQNGEYPVIVTTLTPRLDGEADRAFIDTFLPYLSRYAVSFVVASWNGDLDGGVLLDDWEGVREPLQAVVGPWLAGAGAAP
ncbi:MAG: cellulase family glycosylhydrolase [Myxococcales bacterium]|nr:cellulase family glycosylhydrolase [Myxococcales bacterium]MCB9735510.1 cellulase family glycosylhydrolase [Deltaproteobacteria bacterium]